MQLIANGNAPSNYAEFPDRPSVTVIFGQEDGAALGMARIDLPAGAGLPPHRHSGSDVILAPVSGRVRVTKGQSSIDVTTGDALLIHKDETVALTNPHRTPAEVTIVTSLRDTDEPGTPPTSGPVFERLAAALAAASPV